MLDMPKISIRVNVLTVMLLIAGAMAASLLLSQYYFSQKLAIESTHKTFELIFKNITEHIRVEGTNTRNMLTAKSQQTELLEPITFDPFHPSLKGLVEALQVGQNLYAIYFAQQNGHFYEVVNMQDKQSLFDVYKAPEQTAWTVITIIDNQQQLAFLNDNLELINKTITAKKYDPRVRPWYVDAINAEGVIRTKPYLFSHLNQAGITYATQLESKGVVLALDFTMEQFNKILSLQKVDAKSEVFLISSKGTKIASSAFINEKESQQAEEELISKPIAFSEEEVAYIKNHHALLISNENDWPPFDFEEAGEPKGFSIDLMRLLSKKSGLKLQFMNGYQWSEIMTMFKKRELDIVHALYKTQKREEMGLFSDSTFSFKNYFIVPKGAPDIAQFSDIKGETVVVVKGWATQSFMQKNHPAIPTLVVDSVEEAFLALSKGEADFMIESKESFLYQQQRLSIENLKISGWNKELDKGQANNIYIMVQNDQPILLSIINKTLAALTAQEQQNLQQKWFKNIDVRSDIKTLDSELMKLVIANKTDVVVEYEKTGDQGHYFGMISPLRDGSFLGVKIDADALLKPYIENIKTSLLIAAVLLLIALLTVLRATNYIVRPIKALILENEKIKNREFDDVKNIKTHILELEELSVSFVSMSHSIQQFEKVQEELLDAMIKLIAEAIDEKSPYTGGHCKRVPVIAFLLLDAASRSKEGVFEDFSFTGEDELREFEIGAWLHDCGKVTTPEYVVDKATKLETIYNRINEIRMRFEVLWRDAEIDYLNKKISLEDLQEKRTSLVEDFEFIAEANIGGEFMGDDQKDRVKAIAEQQWSRNFDDKVGLSEIEKERFIGSEDEALPVIENLLSDKTHHIVQRTNFNHETYESQGFKLPVPEHLYNYGEVYNLCIERGTLSPEERYKINEHVIMSIKMLEKIPFPENMQNIPEYAGTHHETLIGTGYPRKLTKEELSVPARIMAIADIYEALTASDRPYKKAKTLSASIKIMSFMVKDQHIDADLFRLFLSSGVYKKYAEKYLNPEQIDDVDIASYLT
ncbi:MAG: transporter substrate-binding domain-containing protein [Piscirickettsiaceae bacterium]|nr:transporter substrate-binding domain-containing protein [Piscirickettsiaceae bacterium]